MRAILSILAAVVFILAAFVLIGVWQGSERRKCDDRGGVLVREYPLSFKCVAGPSR